jgi:hypothetical protein
VATSTRGHGEQRQHPRRLGERCPTPSLARGAPPVGHAREGGPLHICIGGEREEPNKEERLEDDMLAPRVCVSFHLTQHFNHTKKRGMNLTS